MYFYPVNFFQDFASDQFQYCNIKESGIYEPSIFWFFIGVSIDSEESFSQINSKFIVVYGILFLGCPWPIVTVESFCWNAPCAAPTRSRLFGYRHVHRHCLLLVLIGRARHYSVLAAIGIGHKCRKCYYFTRQYATDYKIAMWRRGNRPGICGMYGNLVTFKSGVKYTLYV